MTLEELKALDIDKVKSIAYDTLAQLEQVQQTLRVLNQVIAEKSQEKKEPKDAPKD
jgi:hypothetical protein